MDPLLLGECALDVCLICVAALVILLAGLA